MSHRNAADGLDQVLALLNAGEIAANYRVTVTVHLTHCEAGDAA
jgi:hypothetical protein